MSIKALFFDIDGTLVSFKTHVIPQSTIDALVQAKQRGIKVYISTGRPVQLIINLQQITSLIDGYITANGAHCFVDDTTICCHDIPRPEVDRILATAKECDEPVVVVGDKHIAVYNDKPILSEVFRVGLGLNDYPFSTLEDIRDERILQVTPFITQEQEQPLMPLLPSCTSARWYPAFTDITNKQADKGKGLHALAAHEGIDISETMAFGDGGNDVPIIKEAGIGVAMGNAVDEVKQTADFVTRHIDEDGVAYALRHFGVIS